MFSVRGLSRSLILFSIYFLGHGAYGAVYSFEDILQFAKSHTPRRQLIDASYQSNIADIAATKSGVFPQVSLGTSYAQTDASTISRVTPGMNTGNALGSSRLKSSQFDWNLTLAQSVSPTRLGLAAIIADESEGLFGIKKELDEDIYHMEVVRAYGDALISLENSRVSANSLSQLKSVLVFTEIESQGGGRTNVDLLRAKAAFEDARARSAISKITHQSHLAKLKVLLGKTDEKSFQISRSKNTKISFLKVTSGAVTPRREIKIKSQEHKIASLSVKYEKSLHWPSFTFFARAQGVATDYPDIPNFGAAPEDAFKTDRRDYSVGINMDWTIFGGYRISSNHRKAVENAKIASLELAEMKMLEESSRAEAKKHYDMGSVLYGAAQASAHAARLAFEQSDADYKSGQMRLTDVLDAEREFRSKEGLLAEAWVRWLMAAANLRLMNGQRVIGEI